VVGAAAVSGAVIAVLNERDDDPGGGEDVADEQPAEPGDTFGDEAGDEPGEDPGQSQWRHTFEPTYTGPVWITVQAPDSRVRTLTITWGAWQRQVIHEGTDAVSYLFTKGGGENIPIAVEVAPDAVVEFGFGTPPEGAEDINEDWTRNVDG
jgi:hypothetical protein